MRPQPTNSLGIVTDPVTEPPNPLGLACGDPAPTSVTSAGGLEWLPRSGSGTTFDPTHFRATKMTLRNTAGDTLPAAVSSTVYVIVHDGVVAGWTDEERAPWVQFAAHVPVPGLRLREHHRGAVLRRQLDLPGERRAGAARHWGVPGLPGRSRLGLSGGRGAAVALARGLRRPDGRSHGSRDPHARVVGLHGGPDGAGGGRTGSVCTDNPCCARRRAQRA